MAPRAVLILDPGDAPDERACWRKARPTRRGRCRRGGVASAGGRAASGLGELGGGAARGGEGGRGGGIGGGRFRGLFRRGAGSGGATSAAGAVASRAAMPAEEPRMLGGGREEARALAGRHEPGAHGVALGDEIGAHGGLDEAAQLARGGHPGEPVGAGGVFEGVGHLGGGAEALVAIAVQGPAAHLVERGREIRDEAAHRGDRAGDHPRERDRLVVGLEEGAPGQRLPEDDAHGEEVAAPVEIHGVRLLGREVGDLALDLLRPGDRQAGGGAGHAEVGEAGAPVDADEDVLRGAVAVYQPEVDPLAVGELVGGVEPRERVEHDAHPHRRGQARGPGGPGIVGCPPAWPRALIGGLVEHAQDEAGEGVSLDELHHQEVAGLAHPHLEDGHHVGVVDPGGEPGLVEEHLDELLFPGEVRVELLDGDEPREAARPGEPAQVDGGHPPGGQLADELVGVELPSLVVGIEDADPRREGEVGRRVGDRREVFDGRRRTRSSGRRPVPRRARRAARSRCGPTGPGRAPRRPRPAPPRGPAPPGTGVTCPR